MKKTLLIVLIFIQFILFGLLFVFMDNGSYTNFSEQSETWFLILLPIVASLAIIWFMFSGVKSKKIKKYTAMALVTIVLLNFFNTDISSIKVSAEGVEQLLLVEDIPDSIANSIDKEDLENVVITDDNINNLNSLTTKDNNGLKRAYIFSEPIKYVDEKGKIKFKSEKTVKSNKLFDMYEYYGEDNNILCYFPKKIKDGIKIENDAWNLTFTPVTNKNSKPEKKTVTFNGVTEEMIEYPEVFDKYTTLQYKPLVNGIKENIVLSQYNGRNTFDFEINIGGLVPAYYEGESIPLLDPNTNEISFILGQVDARDSFTGENVNNDRHFTLYNSLKLTESKKGKYILTITVDKEFLESETTVYPVVIDPTVNATYSIIEDVTVSSDSPDTPSPYANACLEVGRGDYNEICKTYFKLTDMSAYLDVASINIQDAAFVVNSWFGRREPRQIVFNKVDTNWDQTTITWNNQPTMGEYVADMVIREDDSGWFEFIITDLFREWNDYSRNEGGTSSDLGFCLSAFSAVENYVYRSVLIYSTEYSSKRPYFFIAYNDETIFEGVYYIRNVESGKYLDTVNRSSAYSTSVIQDDFYGGQSQQWLIEESDIDGYYFIRPMHAPLRKFDVYDNFTENGSDIRICSEGYVGDSCRWQIILNSHFTDGSYRLICKESGKAAVVEGASHAAGANVFQYTYTTGQDRNDDWILEYVDVNLKVPLIPQVKKKWCWAACSEMMARFKDYDINYTQTDAAIYTYGLDENGEAINMAANAYQVESAVEYMLGGTETVNAYHRQIYSPSVLTTVLQDSPVIAAYGKLNDSNVRKEGHFVIICGFYYNLAGELRLLINDPDTTTSGIICGETYYVDYDEFKYTQRSNVWDSIVVFADASEVANTVESERSVIYE